MLLIFCAKEEEMNMNGVVDFSRFSVFVAKDEDKNMSSVVYF